MIRRLLDVVHELLSYECLNMPKENVMSGCYQFCHDILPQSPDINNLYYFQPDSIIVPVSIAFPLMLVDELVDASSYPTTHQK